MWCFQNTDLSERHYWPSQWGEFGAALLYVSEWPIALTELKPVWKHYFVFLFNDVSYVKNKFNWQKQPWCDAKIVCKNRLWCKPHIQKKNHLESIASWAALQHILQLGCASSESWFMFVSYVIALSLPPTSLPANSILYYTIWIKGKKMQ